MDKSLYKKLPGSTNAQELMHSQYYMCGATNQSILTGLENLLLFVISLEVDYENKIVELYGTIKPSQGKRSKGAGVNDCRPSDTTEVLLKNQSSKNSNKDNGNLKKSTETESS
ncbi:11450_t:CDS:2 [Entrophospora sp. SA101]|nr:11450_t:CDS:2 [Entrophospora sp. SA101]